MSYFGVTIEKIEKISPHGNADKLEIAKLEGLNYVFCVGKGTFKENDYVFYFQSDTILPDFVAEKLGVLGKLAGNQKNRIKVTRLRGILSDGIVAPVNAFTDWLPISVFPEELQNIGSTKVFTKEEKEANGIIIAERLGCTHYEAPEIPCKSGNLQGLPNSTSMYDIESTDRELEMLAMLMDKKVEISSKLEGSNFSVMVKSDNDVEPDGIKVWVNQRRHTIVPLNDGSEHTWWKIARTDGIIDFAKWILTSRSEWEDKVITVYGEALGPGIQGNYYNFKETCAYLFDIKVGDEWLNPVERMNLINEWNLMKEVKLNHVPIIATGMTLREWLGDKTIAEKADMQSLIDPKLLEEGIVIKCYEDIKFGNKRLFLKKRSIKYLAQTGN